MVKNGLRIAAWLGLGALLQVGGARALAPDNLELLVHKDHAVGAAGGAFAAYGYQHDSTNFFTGVFGSGAGIRSYDANADTSVQYVYPSDQARMERADEITNGYCNADWPGGWYISSLILNPTPLQYNGVSYPPNSLAILTTMPAMTDSSWAYTRCWLTYDLREIWAGTSRQPDYANAQDGVGNVWGQYGVANWNDVITSLASVQDLADAAGVSEITRSSRNGRQAAWSSDGQSVYMVDHGLGNGFGGIWKKNMTNGALTRIVAEEAGLRGEPWVVPSSLRDVTGSAPGRDQILVYGSATLGNRGGINFAFDDGTVGVALPSGRLAHHLGQEGKPTALTADDEGVVYLFNQEGPNYGLHAWDSVGRLYCIDNKARRYAWHRANGNTSSASMSLRLQARDVTYDPDEVPGNGDEYDMNQLMFMSVNLKGVGGINCFRPGDFDRDGAITASDTAFFATQYARTKADPGVLTIEDTQAYLDYIKADLDGNAAPDDVRTHLLEYAVTAQDVDLLLRFIHNVPGDANLDGFVNAADQAIITANFGGPGCWLDGDFDRDGDVDADDLAAWSANHGTSYALDGFDASASYLGGVSGSWDTDVRKTDGTTPPDADTLVNLNLAGGANIAGPVADTRVAWLTIGHAGSGSPTTLSVPPQTRLTSSDGIHLRSTGGLDGWGALAMGSHGDMGTLHAEDGALLGAHIDIFGGLHLDCSGGVTLPNYIGDNGKNPGGLSKGGTGVLTLTGTASDYTGTTHVRQGTLVAGAAGCLPDVSRVDVEEEAMLDATGFNETIGGLSGEGFVDLGSMTLTIDTPLGVTSVWSGAVSGPGTLVKTGEGALYVTGAASNTFGGAGQTITVEEGALQLAEDDGMGHTANTVTLSGGAFYASRSFSTPRTIHVGAAGGALDVAPSTSLNFSGTLAGPGSLEKNGEGILYLQSSATGTFGGPGRTFTLRDGICRIRTDAVLGDPATELVFDGGWLRVNANISSARSMSVGPSNGTFEVDSGYTATMSGPLGGGGALLKEDNGTLVLGGAVACADGLRVDDGTVKFNNGTVVGTDIFVAPGAYLDTLSVSGAQADLNGHTLQVAGTVRGGATDGTVSPGLSPGTATFDSAFVMDGASAYRWEIDDVAGTGGTSPGWDWIRVTGPLQITATAADPYTIRLVSLDVGGGAAPVSNFDGGTNYAWVIATGEGGVTGFAADRFVVDVADFAHADALGTWRVARSGNDLVLHYDEPQPELTLLSPDTGFRAFFPSDLVSVTWSSALLQASAQIGIDLVRDAAPGPGPDGVDWYRFTSGTPNDGAQTVTIPSGLAQADDWRFSITNAPGAYDASSVPMMVGVDLDDDGLPDAWEVAHFTNIANFSGVDDPDHDGGNNLHELYADTDPDDADSVLGIREWGLVPPGEVRMAWPSSTQRVYHVQSAPAAGETFDEITDLSSTSAQELSYTGKVESADGAVYRVEVETTP